MKGPTVAARLKHLQQGSLERPKTRKQKEDFPKVQGQQQVFHFWTLHLWRLASPKEVPPSLQEAGDENQLLQM